MGDAVAYDRTVYAEPALVTQEKGAVLEAELYDSRPGCLISRPRSESGPTVFIQGSRLTTAWHDRVLEGKSFDFHDDMVRPPYLSAKGHGTVMASMILHVCPMVKVYPIRLKTYDNEHATSNIDANYATQVGIVLGFPSIQCLLTREHG